MAEDIAFRIQLGLILPKIKEKVGDELCGIVKELAGILQSGNVEGEGDIATDLNDIKEIFMKDMEIYLTKEVMPVISASLASDTGGEEKATEESAVEEGETAEE